MNLKLQNVKKFFKVKMIKNFIMRRPNAKSAYAILAYIQTAAPKGTQGLTLILYQLVNNLLV